MTSKAELMRASRARKRERSECLHCPLPALPRRSKCAWCGGHANARLGHLIELAKGGNEAARGAIACLQAAMMEADGAG